MSTAVIGRISLSIDEACERKNVDVLGLFVLAKNLFANGQSASLAYKLWAQGGPTPQFVLQYLRYLSGQTT